MLNLIPAPRGSVHMQEGSVKLPETVTVSLGDFAPWCLEAFAARLGGHVEIAENGFITLKRADIAKEGYKLTVTKDGITVEAADESGAVWALTTVTELTAEGEALPIVTIEDAPHYGHRGLSLDCSRHFFTADEVKKVIDQMTRVKLNVLHWHLVDDQGLAHRVQNAAAAARNDRHVLHAGGDQERYRICPRARHGDHPGNRYAGPHQIDDCGIPAFELLWRKNGVVPVWRHF